MDWMLRHGLLEDRFSFEQHPAAHGDSSGSTVCCESARAERVASACSLYDNTWSPAP